jgi:hypothetical protein
MRLQRDLLGLEGLHTVPDFAPRLRKPGKSVSRSAVIFDFLTRGGRHLSREEQRQHRSGRLPEDFLRWFFFITTGNAPFRLEKSRRKSFENLTTDSCYKQYGARAANYLPLLSADLINKKYYFSSDNNNYNPKISLLVNCFSILITFFASILNYFF